MTPVPGLERSTLNRREIMSRGSPHTGRRRASRLAVALLAMLVVAFGLPGSAHATLQLLKPDPSVAATFVGHGGYSADGLGQFATGGTVQAEVPAGSTVVHAYL